MNQGNTNSSQPMDGMGGTGGMNESRGMTGRDMTGRETRDMTGRDMRDTTGGEMPDIRNVYPEIFYRIQPYIMMICDQLDAYYGNSMPDQGTLDEIAQNIYDDMREAYPDLEFYTNEGDEESAFAEVIARTPSYYRRNFRRRGLLRDLVDILFFSEFYRRRRRPYYNY